MIEITDWKNDSFDEEAINIVRNYIFDKYRVKTFRTFIVWKCKTIQNRKYIIGTDYENNFFELTFNGDKNEYYLDVYYKVDKKIIKM